MEFYVKCAIFSILKWNFQNINAVTAELYLLPGLSTATRVV